jgi:hypothetical protein
MMDLAKGKGWIAVDLDGTLAEQPTGATGIGKPVPAMVKRVRSWLARGYDVKIFTTRASQAEQIRAIKEWLSANRLPDLDVTNVKAPGLAAIWDNRAVRVPTNTGKPCSGCACAANYRVVGGRNEILTDCGRRDVRVGPRRADQAPIMKLNWRLIYSAHELIQVTSSSVVLTVGPSLPSEMCQFDAIAKWNKCI